MSDELGTLLITASAFATLTLTVGCSTGSPTVSVPGECAVTGVPLILDDTLGHCDPARLEGMGALLSFAARWCQIIVLTCTYTRFRHVGDARVIRLQ